MLESPLAAFNADTEVSYFSAMVYRDSPCLTVWWVLELLVLVLVDALDLALVDFFAVGSASVLALVDFFAVGSASVLALVDFFAVGSVSVLALVDFFAIDPVSVLALVDFFAVDSVSVLALVDFLAVCSVSAFDLDDFFAVCPVSALALEVELRLNWREESDPLRRDFARDVGESPVASGTELSSGCSFFAILGGSPSTSFGVYGRHFDGSSAHAST